MPAMPQTAPAQWTVSSVNTWGSLDWVAVAGAASLGIGAVCALVRRLRPGGVLLPIGVGLVAIAALGTRMDG
jgi:hypothetical protein